MLIHKFLDTYLIKILVHSRSQVIHYYCFKFLNLHQMTSLCCGKVFSKPWTAKSNDKKAHNAGSLVGLVSCDINFFQRLVVEKAVSQ